MFSVCIKQMWSSSSSCGFPATSMGFTSLGEIFACDRFFVVCNPTIEAVTFRLHGWCMLGAFLLPAFTRLGHECQGLLRLLLPAFTRLGHECQGLLSLCNGMHACTD